MFRLSCFLHMLKPFIPGFQNRTVGVRGGLTLFDAIIQEIQIKCSLSDLRFIHSVIGFGYPPMILEKFWFPPFFFPPKT